MPAFTTRMALSSRNTAGAPPMSISLLLLQPEKMEPESLRGTWSCSKTSSFMMIDFVVLLGSLTVVFVLSSRLQRVISEPIRELAETAATFSAHENYSMRATKRSNDEIGVLVNQFNGMLDRLQQRDVSLQQARDGLEKSVAERTSYLNALIENSPLGILVLDSRRFVKQCNPAFETLFQYTRLEVAGKTIDGLIADGDLLSEIREISRRTLDGEVINVITRCQRKDRSIVDVELHTVRLMVDGKVEGTLYIYQDISVRKRAEEEMQPKHPTVPKANSLRI